MMALWALVLQCWFKLSGQIEQNLNFQTRFSQIGLRLDKKWREQKLLRISPELICCHFFSEILNKIFAPKVGHFGFFQLIKNCAETTLLIDMKVISQEAYYAVQQSLRGVKFPKICANCLKFIFKQRFWVLYSKNHIYWLSSEIFFIYTGFWKFIPS